MWNPIQTVVRWLHEPEHVARFQRYFGVLPIANRKPDVIPKCDRNHLSDGNDNNLSASGNGRSDPYHRHHERKVTYDTNVLDECIEEIKHSAKESTSTEIDYRITSWFWYYFFQFGAALGNEIFYILFFPTW